MGEWWSALGLELQIYWGVGLAAAVAMTVQTLLLFFGGDLIDAGDVDLEGPDAHPSGLGLISARTVVAFALGFGFTGIFGVAQGFASRNTAGLAIVGGAVFMLAVFYLMRLLYDLRDSGTLDYHNAIGAVGTVYLPIPPGMEAAGRIQVVVQGRLKVIQALTRHDQRLENRARVRVVELLDENTLVVAPLAAELESAARDDEKEN